MSDIPEKIIFILLLILALTQVQGNGVTQYSPDRTPQTPQADHLSGRLVRTTQTAVGSSAANSPNIYLILYATHAGQTGHVGVATDDYQVKISDCARCVGGVKYDTVTTGELRYYDLWPAEDDWSYSFFFGSVEARYYQLPNSTTARSITTRSLVNRGLPHALDGPCDGLLKLPVTWRELTQINNYLSGTARQKEPFNLYEFNCSNYALRALRLAYPELAVREERVLARYATTPNRLWEAAKELGGVTLLKDPGLKAKGRFNSERIFPDTSF